MNFDLRYVPFSRYGSYLACSLLARTPGDPPALWLRQMSGHGQKEAFRLEVLAEGQPVPFETVATPSLLELRSARGAVRLCIAADDLLRIRGLGAGLRLSAGDTDPFGCAIPWMGERWLVNLFRARRQYMLTPLQGTLRMDAPWQVARCAHVVADFLPDPQTGQMEGALEQFDGSWEPREYPEPFEDCVRACEAGFQCFRQFYPSVPDEYTKAAELAAYVNWASVVSPRGLLKRPAMLMSKNWMTNVWSWDHCFNAMALSYGAPDLAWDQMMIIFDQQQPNGQLPDSINDADVVLNFVKPPVHGWALRHMVTASPHIGEPHLAELYPKLARWTDWWFTCRNPDGDGLPQYHHGNDSGWDNGTVFDAGFPVKGADLAAFLVLQMDVLAEAAARLGKPAEAETWQQRADGLLGTLLSRLWRGDRFVSPRATDGAIAERSDSVFNCLPLVLGQRLPLPVRRQLVMNLQRYLTPYGPATEHIHSPLYEDDGYWRGPIWAPSTLLLVDGLRACGETALAAGVARRFCDLAKQSGFAENYNARTGEPLRDRAYTWTSSVFLILAHEYLADEYISPPSPRIGRRGSGG